FRLINIESTESNSDNSNGNVTDEYNGNNIDDICSDESSEDTADDKNDENDDKNGVSAGKRDQIDKKFFFEIINDLYQMIKSTSILLRNFFFKKKNNLFPFSSTHLICVLFGKSPAHDGCWKGLFPSCCV